MFQALGVAGTALLGFVAGHGECVGHDLAGVLALVLDLARAEGGELAAGLKLEADGRERHSAKPCTQNMTIAKTAAAARPASSAAFCIIVVATMPPASGGMPAMTSVPVMKGGATNQHGPRAPASARNTDDHGLPLLEQALETEERAHVGDEEEDGDGGAQRQKLRVRNERLREEGSQKAMRISTAEMKTDGTQPFVNLESTSPSRMMTRQAAKAEQSCT